MAAGGGQAAEHSHCFGAGAGVGKGAAQQRGTAPRDAAVLVSTSSASPDQLPTAAESRTSLFAAQTVVLQCRSHPLIEDRISCLTLEVVRLSGKHDVS